MLRRKFIAGLAVFAAARHARAALTSKERVNLALKGEAVDRPPFTLWHHFGLKTPEAHARRTLEFHRSYRTDIVKVMSDFPYPKSSSGKWYELRVERNPFPAQIQALELIRTGLNGEIDFIETIFNPWTVAEKLSSRDELLRLKQENPDALFTALDVIARSEIEHAKRAIRTGASGILLAVANPNRQQLSPEDYRKFSAPFDKRILEAASAAKMNTLHLHWQPEYVDLFTSFPAPIINFSTHVSGVPIANVRKHFPKTVIAGGIDETKYRTLSAAELKQQWRTASDAAGPAFILTPGCSVPDNSQPQELAKLPSLVGA
jgi:uroporphyrinogen decarboxylase